MSSSSWGCELKYFCFIEWKERNSHPLREDVSWNIIYCTTNQCIISHPLREDVSWNTLLAADFASFAVILFVRMWVEIKHTLATDYEMWSSSSWGCELKCDISMELVLNGNVILFVRMWVEIWVSMSVITIEWCHPLREDVSWNDLVIVLVFVTCMSSSSWGCELKLFRNIK